MDDGSLRAAAAEASSPGSVGPPSAARPGGHSRLAAAIALTALACALLPGCAHRSAARPVPIESRPTPPQPEPTSTATPGPDSAQAPRPSTQPAGTARARAIEDTLAVRSALQRCAGRKLLPEQEGLIESAERLLGEVRAALDATDFSLAESRARQARQLTRSLNCP